MTSDGRPYVICHMTSSVDGRIKTRRWKTLDADSHFERVHGALKGDAWMCGRVTMQGYADSADPLPEPVSDDGPISRDDHVARRDAPGYAVALDARGRLDWGARNAIEGDHIVVVLTESVPDELSLLLAPAVDGLSGTPAVFDFAGDEEDSMGGRRKLELTACERLSGGVVWLRYRITPVDPSDRP